MLVYCIKNTINNKEYIGLTTRTLQERWKQHIRESNKEGSWEWNTPLGNAIKKYGKDSFEIFILEECSSEDEMKQREIDFIKERYPLHSFERSAKILKELRAIKLPEEISVMQKAIDITENTFRRLLKFVKPGVMEYEIDAEIWHSFLSQRATRPAYGSIIASGDRARILHYVENNQECKDGELLLMDFGAEYGNYCADLTRTIPVNGKFTRRQKMVYNACLHLHQYAASILKPGISIVDYTKKVGDEATVVFHKIGLIKKSDIKNEDPENRAYAKYLYHGISHHLGIDVHDLGTRTAPIQAGMVFTVEPGIYIEEEQMGIRIENNFWITRNGNKDLMKNIPITTDEIEAWMKK